MTKETQIVSDQMMPSKELYELAAFDDDNASLVSEEDRLISDRDFDVFIESDEIVVTERVRRFLQKMGFEINPSGFDFGLLPSKQPTLNESDNRFIDFLDESDEEPELVLEKNGSENTVENDNEGQIDYDDPIEENVETEKDRLLINIEKGEEDEFQPVNIEAEKRLIRADQINFAELDRILRIKPHSRFIRWLLTDNLIRKALVSVFTHRWPRNITMPTKRFRHAKAAGAFSHTDKLVKYIWDALLVSFFTQDFIDYYVYPDYRNGRSLLETLFTSRGNKKLLAESLYNYYVAGILIGVPLTVGLLHSTYDYFRANKINLQKFPEGLLSSLQSHWYSRFYKDYLRWVNPFNGAKRKLDKAQETLIGDGRSYLTAAERVNLFNCLMDAIKSSRGMTRLYAIWTLQYLAYGISTEDIKKLSKKYKTDKERLQFREELKAHLVIRTRALEFLRQIAKNKVPQKKYHLHERLLAEELLWEIGFPAKNPLHPAHGFALAVFGVDSYFRITLLILLIQGLQYSYDQFKQRRDCLKEGKLWLYMSQPGKIMCTVCGNFQINYKQTLTDQDCLDAYLSSPKNATEVARLFSQLTCEKSLSLDFSNQNADGDYLAMALPAIRSGCKFSKITIASTGFIVVYPSQQSFAAILETLHRVTVDQMRFLVNHDENWNLTMSFGSALAVSKVKSLTFFSGTFSDSLLYDLAVCLNKTNLKTINLSYFPFFMSDRTFATFITQLPFSSVSEFDVGELLGTVGNLTYAAFEKIYPNRLNMTTLNLSGEMTAEFAQALRYGLTGSTIGELGLYWMSATDESIIQLAPLFQQANISTVVLSNNCFGARGVKALAEGLVGSPVQVVNLGWVCYNYYHCLNDSAIIPFVKKLSSTNVRSLDIRHNNIGDVGISALAAVLPKTSISSLDVYGNPFSDKGLFAISEVLSLTKLTDLKIDYDNFSEDSIIGFFKAISNSSLSGLCCRSSVMGDAAAIALSKSIKYSSLKQIILWSNNITAKGMAAIIAETPVSKIYDIDLTFNNNGSAFNDAVRRHLPHSNITSLSLDSMINHEMTMVAVADAIKQGAPIKSLTLTGGKGIVNDLGIVAIAEVLPFSQLDSIIFYIDNMSIQGASCLARYIPQSVLTSFDIVFSFWADGYQYLDDEFINALSPAVQGNNLRDFELVRIMLSDKGANILSGYLIKQTNLIRPLWINQLFDKHSYNIQIESATSLTYFTLTSSNISVNARNSICKVLPYTQIGYNNFEVVHGFNCPFYSSATSYPIPFPFELIAQVSEKIYILSNKILDTAIKHVLDADPVSRYDVFKKRWLNKLKIRIQKQKLNPHTPDNLPCFYPDGTTNIISTDPREIEGVIDACVFDKSLVRKNSNDEYYKAYYAFNDRPSIEWIIAKTTSKNVLYNVLPELLKDVLIHSHYSQTQAYFAAKGLRIALMALEMPMLISGAVSFTLSKLFQYAGVSKERSEQISTILLLTGNIGLNLPTSLLSMFYMTMILVSSFYGTKFAMHLEKMLVNKYFEQKKLNGSEAKLSSIGDDGSEGFELDDDSDEDCDQTVNSPVSKLQHHGFFRSTYNVLVTPVTYFFPKDSKETVVEKNFPEFCLTPG